MIVYGGGMIIYNSRAAGQSDRFEWSIPLRKSRYYLVGSKTYATTKAARAAATKAKREVFGKGWNDLP